MEMEEVARWAFILFVVIAIAMGLAVGFMRWNGQNVSMIDGYVLLIMLILGIIIGITSITAKEVTPFLIATIALIVATSANVWASLSNIHDLLFWWAKYILNYVVAFAAPAAVIISTKYVFAITKD